VSADPLDFGVYNPLSGSHADAVGNVSVTCGALVLGANISYEVTLGTGMSGGASNRTMSNGSGTLNYNLYTDSSRVLVWGDGAGGTHTITHSYLLSLIFSTTDNFPVYGRIPSGQNAEAGSYSDTILVTVIF
jgi:spore coat protein U-like protein